MKRLFSSRPWAYVLGVGLVVLTTLAAWAVAAIPFVDPTNTDKLYILSVAISAWYLGFGPSLMVSFLGVLAFDFLFVPPVSTLAISGQQETMNVVILLVVCIAVSWLSSTISRRS